MNRHPGDPQSDDFYLAMREMGSFLDITPSDARELFAVASRHARERIRAGASVAQVMTREVVGLAPDTGVLQAAATLAEAGVSGAPVVQEGRVLGVMSVKDLLPLIGLDRSTPLPALVAWVLAGKACPGIPEELRVKDVMTSPARTVPVDAAAADAARVMTGHGLRRLPVLDGERLVGIVTRTDLVRALGDLLEEAQ
ncbi:CBS domain-containing protein [Fundidesulfovibrio agrisoli]|uniref:CBS domain-containing protein n=1 Tax=Fundidesulfovibrio agrisoli TaxID=2922717 RepID=UPI001FAC1B04|nr:CBS domain-containing protein [Fundidesulfovibrio agrisoli]